MGSTHAKVKESCWLPAKIGLRPVIVKDTRTTSPTRTSASSTSAVTCPSDKSSSKSDSRRASDTREGS
jgi:hypothetical protein